MNVLSMRNDSKAAQINQAAKELGYSVSGSSFSRDALFFVYLLCQIIKFRKPKAIIVRYLNDHPNLFRSLFLAFNVITTLALARIFKIKILWFLHNVDRETTVNFPRITSFLRFFVGRFSEVIFVTDPLLVPIAQELHPQWANKIDFITFGLRNDKRDISTDAELMNVLLSLQGYRKHGGKVLFCPTGAGEKYSHIAQSVNLCNMASKNNLNYKIVVVGNLTNYLKLNPELKSSIYNHENIILLNKYIKYDAIEISSLIDIYWRSLSDQSVSFTLYEAASVKKPILTLDEGFLGVAIEKYKLGAALNLDMKNLKVCHERLLKWNDESAAEFLANHSWNLTAKKIKCYLEAS